MITLNRRLQAVSAEFTLMDGDRVHPGPPGHFVAAFYFLQAQGVRGTVAIAHLDAATRDVRRAENCTVSDLTTTPQSVSFNYLADSLPFPVPTEAAHALEWVPFQTALSREELRIQGLSPGTYQLTINDRIIATFDAADLARGINLAERSIPQLAQSRKALVILQKRWWLLGRLSIVAIIDSWVGRGLPRPITLEAIEPALATWEAELAAPPDHLQRNQPAEYRKFKPIAAELAAQASKLLAEARVAARLVAHRISLTFVIN